MPDKFEDVNFPTDPLNVTNVCDFLLLQDFDGYFLLGQLVNSQFHLSEGSLSQSLFYNQAKKYKRHSAQYVF